MPTYKSAKPQDGFLPVVELFETVQGEGIYAGVPSVFFRTGMCNLACPGCDTVWDEWRNRSIDDVADEIVAFKAKHVVLTGGEPFLWQKGLAQLMKAVDVRRSGMVFTVESNGAVPLQIEGFVDRIDLFSFSPKVGSLGHDEIFLHAVVLKNIELTSGANQLKYVLDPAIPEHVESVFAFHARVEAGIIGVPDDRVFFQPYDTETLVNIKHAPGLDDRDTYLKRFAALTDLVMQRSGSRFRVLPQMHKLLSYR